MRRFLRVVGVALWIPFTLGAIDNLHFYRANFWWAEPRFERAWLSTLDVAIGGGSTSQARNGTGKKVPLLEIYGPQNLQYLARGVPGIDSSNPLNQLLLAVQNLPYDPPFGFVRIFGALSLNEAVLDFKQNFITGLFTQVYLPVRSFHLKHTRMADSSTGHPLGQTAQWRQLLNSLDQVLALHGLTINGYKQTGPGDLTVALGWTRNYQNTTYVDFVDWTLKVGALFPTGLTTRSSVAFDLPTGYNGHYGISLDADGSVGLWEWLTLGINTGALWLNPQEKSLRVRTDPTQQGFIKLACTQATVQPGTYWHAGCYVKGDHFNEVFSCALGYSYNQKSADHVIAQSTFDARVINSDQAYKAWSMHTFHVFAEFDLAHHRRIWHPRISIFYNTPCAGKRIFTMAMGGAQFGLDITWKLD
jgi:hypothetical protein